MRGAAAVGIVAVHVWLYVQGDHAARAGTLLDGVVGQLRLGLPMFFVLSGYLIFRPYAAAAIEGRALPNLGVYALRRAARIAPAYWLVIVLTFAVLAALGHGEAQPLSALPTFLLFLQNYDPATLGHLNPPTWTVAVEVSFYVLVPLLAIGAAAAVGRLRSPAHRRAVLAAGCVVLLLIGAMILGQSAVHGWGRNLRDLLPARLASFGAGMLVAVLAHGRTVRRPTTLALAGGGAALVLLEAGAHVFDLGSPVLRQAVVDTPASIGFALLIASVATGRMPGAVLFERGPLQWYGSRSYGLYLVHFPVIYALRSLDLFPRSPALAFGTVLALGTLLAMVLWHVVERPSIAWARRRTPSPRRTTRPVLAGASGD